MSFKDLPEEIILFIISHLIEIKDIIHFSVTDKRNNKIVNDNKKNFNHLITIINSQTLNKINNYNIIGKLELIIKNVELNVEK